MEDNRTKELTRLFRKTRNLYDEIVDNIPEFENAEIRQILAEGDFHRTPQGAYTIAVVGDQNVGKTTLLNSLFFDCGLQQLDFPLARKQHSLIPIVIELQPHAEDYEIEIQAINREQFIAGLHWLLQNLPQNLLSFPENDNLTPLAFAEWVEMQAIPRVRQAKFSGKEQCIRQLSEAIQIFRSLTPEYAVPGITNIRQTIAAIHDAKLARMLRCIFLVVPTTGFDYPIRLVDFPSFACNNIVHQQFLHRFIVDKVDLILLVKDSQNFVFKKQENDFLAYINSHVVDIEHTCLVVFNKWYDTDHPGAEKAIRDLIHKHHLQSRNIFRISALPGVLYGEQQNNVDIEGKYKKLRQESALNKYYELYKKFGDQIPAEVGISQLRDFLEYCCENSIPAFDEHKYAKSICELLTSMEAQLANLVADSKSVAAPLEQYHNTLENFKENVHCIESRLDDFSDSLQQSLGNVIAQTHSFEHQAHKFSSLLTRIGLRKSATVMPVENTSEHDEIIDSVQEIVPQRPTDLFTYLVKEIFPTIDIYQRARVVLHYTAGRAKIHSHEIELAVIRDVNKMLREKLLTSLRNIVNHHIEVFWRTIDNEGYVENIDNILTTMELEAIRSGERLHKFVANLKQRLHENCEVMAEVVIKQLDEVGVYSEDLNRVAAMPSDTQQHCSLKQEQLLAYLEKNYQRLLTLAWKIVNKSGWDEISETIAKSREKLIGLLGRYHIITSKILAERQYLQSKGVSYHLALFEEIEQAIKEKIAICKDATADAENMAKISTYRDSIQNIIEQCQRLTPI